MSTLSPRQRHENSVFPLAHYFASQEAGLAVCAIQKNGCTTLKRWYLSVAEPDSVFPESVDVHYHCRVRHALCKLAPPQTPGEVLDRCFTIAFVRDPFARLASAFMDKFAGPPPEDLFEPTREVIEDCARAQGLDVTHDRARDLVLTDRTIPIPYSSVVDYHRGITFREFADYLRTAPDEHLDGHWRSQASFLAAHHFDLIARVESLTDILREISAATGRGSVPPERHSKTFYSEHASGPYCDIPSGELHRQWIRPRAEQLFDDSVRSVIRERFAADVALYDDAATRLEPAHMHVLLTKSRGPSPA